MIKLIKNELVKVFKKKSIYVMLIITFAFMILNSILTNVLQNSVDSNYAAIEVEIYKQELNSLDKELDRDQIISYKSYIQTNELINKYGRNSWQKRVIEEKVQPLIYEMLYAEGTQDYNKYKVEYDNIISKLDSGNWRSFAEEELANINRQISDSEKIGDNSNIDALKDEKQILEWRLEKDISYGTSNLNCYLESWQSTKASTREYQTNKAPTHREKYQNQNDMETISICEYAIKNGLDKKLNNGGNSNLYYGLTDNATTEILNVFDNYSLFIVISIIIIAGTIVSEEFNKGTIKLLLVRPYSRIKILASKFITCLIIIVILFVIVTLMQFVVGGFTYGFDTYTANVPVYNFTTNSMEQIGLVQYLLLLAIAKMPHFILLMTLAFTCSTLFLNSPIAIALPILGFMGTDIINNIAYSFEQAKFLMYFVTPNWDLSIYLFGKMPQFEPINLAFSIFICLVYFAIMIAASIITFKKRNIKNI